MPHKPIVVLGINDGHDCGAALIKDGKVLAAIQEERLSNIKHHSGIPKRSIKEVYKIAQINPQDTDAIAIVSLNRVYSPLEEYPLKVKIFEKLAPYLHGKTFVKIYVKLLHKFRNIKEMMKIFKEIGIENKEIFFVEHHLAHASCTYRTCPWGYDEKVLVMTADGAGDGISSTVNIGEKGEIKRIAYSTFYDSLGNAFYSEITRYLGMKPWDHEYKVMGLAPYGKPEYCIDKMKKIIRLNPKNPLEFKNTFRSYLKSMQPKLYKLLKGERFDNIAAACQAYYEKLFIEWVKNAIKKTGIQKIAFAGGNILNVKANKKVLELEEIDDAFFYPAAGDDGTPVGAALQVYYEICKRDGIKPNHYPLEDLYYGPEFNNEEIFEVIKKEGLSNKAEKYDGIEEIVAELLAKGKIVARFNGRCEWGPRALGNRSILASAKDYKIVRKLNFQIKQRDFWMPFAPTILEERINEYLINARPARYMILAFDTTEKRDEIIAAVHPQDLTVRPQTLNEWNLSYRKILEKFQSLTGIGGILNTSFNLHGYPIVGTIELAIWTFKNSELEYLAIGNYLIKKHS